MTLCFIMIVDDFLGISNSNSMWLSNIWKSFLIVYILIVSGPIGGLNYIFKKIVRVMNRIDLLIKNKLS